MKNKWIATGISIVLVFFMYSSYPTKMVLSAGTFEVSDQRMGNPMISYVGPEIEPYGNRVIYQIPGENNSLWMGFLDPSTGLFTSKDGKDVLIDTDLAPVEESFQGPEWGVSKNSSSIFYCKKDNKGIMQIWKASLDTEPPKVEQLSKSDQKLYCFFTSQSTTSESIKIACLRGDKPKGTAVWFDENSPEQLNVIPRVYTWSQCFRFSPEGRMLFYCSYAVGNRFIKGKSQIGMLDTLTSVFSLLTDDPGNKDDPWPFIAPEYGNELCVATTVNHQTISIYRKLADSKGMWTKVASIDTPKDSKFKYFYSMEPLQLTSRNKNVSYFSLAAFPDDLGDLVPREESSIWILGLGDQLKRRVDAEISGQKNEPETWVNQNNVFLYYTYYRVEKTYKKIEMHCCKTGLLEKNPPFFKYQIDLGDTQRTFYVTLPDTYTKNQPYPMVLILHGGSGSAINVMKDTSWDVLAKGKNFIAVFPEGTPVKDPKTGKEIPNRYSWNDGSVRNNADDVQFVRQLVSFLQERYTIDTNRIYATGFSNGGAMTFRLARELDQVFASIAPVSCSDWLKDPKVSPPLSLLYITGTKDPLNPMEGGRMKRGGVEFGPIKPKIREMIGTWASMVGGQTKGATIRENDYIESLSFSKEEDMSKVFCIFVKDLGHYWPGGNPSLSEDVGGSKKNLNAINATQVIWDFFALHPKTTVGKD
jgi:polyhydroxybutyrate depolymerase